MTDKILNWGLLSSARINRALIPVLKGLETEPADEQSPSRKLETAQAYARECAIPRAHGSYEALLADPEVDVVYVPLPNALHAEWSIKALEAGKHVLCEKPLALTVQEVDAMTAAGTSERQGAGGGVHVPASSGRRDVLKELIDSGKLGRLQLIKGAFTFVLKRTGDVRLTPEAGWGKHLGRGMLSDQLGGG